MSHQDRTDSDIYPGIYPNAVAANSFASHEIVQLTFICIYHSLSLLFTTQTSDLLYLFLDTNQIRLLVKLQENAPNVPSLVSSQGVQF